MLRKKEKKFLCILDSGFRGFINEKYVCATVSYMQLLLLVSAAITIEMGSRLTSPCQCLATICLHSTGNRLQFGILHRSPAVRQHW